MLACPHPGAYRRPAYKSTCCGNYGGAVYRRAHTAGCRRSH